MEILIGFWLHMEIKHMFDYFTVNIAELEQKIPKRPVKL